MLSGATMTITISIHALREEGDKSTCNTTTPHRNFYPRPPRGGRRPCKENAMEKQVNFYPRPPRGGRPCRTPSKICDRNISIHALREEGDRSR